MAATKTSIVVVVVVTTLHHRHLHHILSPFHAHCTHFDPLTAATPAPPFSRYVVSRPLRAGTNCNPRRCCRSRRWCRCRCCCSCCCCCCCCIAPPSTSSTVLCRRCCCRSCRREPTCHAAVPNLSCRSPTRRHLMRRQLFVFRTSQERNTGPLMTVHTIATRYSHLIRRSPLLLRSLSVRFFSGRTI